MWYPLVLGRVTENTHAHEGRQRYVQMEIRDRKNKSYIIDGLHITEVAKLNIETGTLPSCRKTDKYESFPMLTY